MSEREVDAELVARVQRGDKRAFDLLVLKYQRKIMRLLSRMIRDPAEVEDVAQEAFIKAYRALPQFRGDSAFYTWLYRIAINTARNWQVRSEEHTSELQSLMRISYAVFCLKKKKNQKKQHSHCHKNIQT